MFAVVALELYLVVIGRYHAAWVLSVQARDEERTKQENKYIRGKARLSILLGIYMLLALPWFFLFTRGDRAQELTPAEHMGSRERIKAMPEEKPIEQIKEEAAQSKPAELKRQFEGPEKDRQEANDYLDKALKRAKDRKGEGDATKHEAD